MKIKTFLLFFAVCPQVVFSEIPQAENAVTPGTTSGAKEKCLTADQAKKLKGLMINVVLIKGQSHILACKENVCSNIEKVWLLPQFVKDQLKSWTENNIESLAHSSAKMAMHQVLKKAGVPLCAGAGTWESIFSEAGSHDKRPKCLSPEEISLLKKHSQDMVHVNMSGAVKYCRDSVCGKIQNAPLPESVKSPLEELVKESAKHGQKKFEDMTVGQAFQRMNIPVCDEEQKVKPGNN